MDRLKGKVAAITGGRERHRRRHRSSLRRGGRQGADRRSRSGQGRRTGGRPRLGHRLPPDGCLQGGGHRRHGGRDDGSLRPHRRAVQQRRLRRRARPDRVHHRRRLRPHHGRAAEERVPGDQARRPADEGPGIGFDHLDRQRGRDPRRLRAPPLQRRQERGHPSDQDGRVGAGRARHPRQRHLPGVHRHPARRRATRRRRDPDRPAAGGRCRLAGARSGRRAARHREHGAVPRQRRLRRGSPAGSSWSTAASKPGRRGRAGPSSPAWSGPSVITVHPTADQPEPTPTMLRGRGARSGTRSRASVSRRSSAWSRPGCRLRVSATRSAARR